MKRILGFFKNRWFVSIVGLLALSILIWFVGPQIAIAGQVPLKTEVARLLAILLICVLWGLNNLRIQMRVNKANSELAGDFMQQPSQLASTTSLQSEEEVAALRERFDEALQILRKTPGNKGSAGIYDLPWYIIIGPPGSGKTTALINSGLKFPLAERFGKEALRGVGGTRNCDWWFTDDAVLLDTAGRYTTQDSHVEIDSAAWEGFLQLLKKHRSRKPINGALIAISLSDLLTQTEAEQAQQIHAIKQRLQELEKHLGIRFPVYVLLTKCDLIAGFMEFFDDLGQAERGQVWGFTFPFDEAGESNSSVKLLAGEFDALISRLNERVLWRMQQERDPQRRAKMYSFPHQMASLRELLNSFLSQIFSATRYDEPMDLRGVYFTSGTQEGSPIDRVMAALSRTFGLGPQTIRPQGGQGRSYFVTRMLKDVVFEESDLVGANRRMEGRLRWLQRAAYGGAVGLTALAILAWMTSFTRNEVHIYQFKDSLAQYQEIKARQGGRVDSFDQLLQRLNGAKALTEVYDPFKGDVPLLMGMGLYQGNKLTTAAEGLYRQELIDSLLPSITLRLEQHLASGKGGPDFQYEALKTYLMLGNEERRDPELIKLWMDLDWQNMYPDNPEIQGQFQNHLASMLEMGFSSTALNPELIQDTRLSLKSIPLSDLLYGRMKRDYIAVDEQPFRVIDATGPLGRNVFQRRSGVELDQGLTSLFTYEGYHDYFKLQVKEVAALSSEENWVLDPDKSELTDPEIKQLQIGLLDLYFADYIRSWDQLLRDITLVSFKNVQQAADFLNALSLPNSPMRKLLKSVARNTRLTRSGMIDKAVDRASSTNAEGRLARLLQLGSDNKAITARLKGPEIVVDEYFAALNALQEESDTASAPIDQIITMFSQLYELFDSVAMGTADPLSIARGASSADIPSRMNAEANRQPEPVKSWLKQVSKDSRELIASGARSKINEQWKSEVLPLCQRAIDGRYPFNIKSRTEISLVDFGRLFGYDGLFDAFFKTYIKPFVKISRGQWRSTIGISTSALTQFQRATTIRAMYFQAGGQTPLVSFSLKPVFLDANVRSFSLDLEGQQFLYRHGPARLLRAQWPGPNSTGQVRLEFKDDSGARLASTIEGPWAWFRLLGRSELQERTRDIVLASFIDRGRKSTWELRADTVYNPFMSKIISEFRCPGRL